MPIFEYICKNCGKKREKLFFKYVKTIECIDCGSTMTKTPTFSNFVVNGFNEKNGYSNE